MINVVAACDFLGVLYANELCFDSVKFHKHKNCLLMHFRTIYMFSQFLKQYFSVQRNLQRKLSSKNSFGEVVSVAWVVTFE